MNNISLEQINIAIDDIMIEDDLINKSELCNIGFEAFSKTFIEKYEKIGDNDSLTKFHIAFKKYIHKLMDDDSFLPNFLTTQEVTTIPINNNKKKLTEYDIIRNFKAIDKNTYSFLFEVWNFFSICMFDEKRFKIFYNDIILLNEKYQKDPNTTVHFFCNWNEMDAALMLLSFPLTFINLLTDRLIVKKIGYLDTECNLLSYYFLSKCDFIKIGEFGSVTISKTQPINDFSSEVLKVVEDNYETIFTSLVNKGLLTPEEVIKINETPLKPIEIPLDQLKLRIEQFNSGNVST